MVVQFPRLKENLSSLQLLQPDSYLEFDKHEALVFIEDEETGLRGFIAIHNTNRGPAVGGTRFWNYANDDEALRDALRLSRAMSYKCALADVPYGGGKAVLMAPDAAVKNETYLAAYAKKLDSFGCGFYTGEDVGLDEHDIRILSEHTSCIIGRPDIGDLPSRWAALSVFVSMHPALESVYGSASFSERTVAIKGLGNVGLDLAKLVTDAGGSVVAADIDEKKIADAKAALPKMEIVATEEIVHARTDIFAPCALGGDISEQYALSSESKIVCGAANNQLSSERVADLLFERGILYVPDYVANSGGLINVVDELNPKGYDKERVKEKVHDVGRTVQELIQESKRKSVSTEAVAGEIARQRIGI
jgi:leucine dehydrogenase